MKGILKEQFFLLKNNMKNLLISIFIFSVIWIFATNPEKENWYTTVTVILNYFAFITLLKDSSGNDSILYGKTLPLSPKEYEGGIYLTYIIIFLIISFLLGILNVINFNKTENFLNTVFVELGSLLIIGGFMLYLQNTNHQNLLAISGFLIIIVFIALFISDNFLKDTFKKLITSSYWSFILFIIGSLLYGISYFMSVKIVERRSY